MNQGTELAHYGVKGMKWGVRKKYEGKGGSYTKRGVDKFNTKLDAYEKAKANLKNAKASGSKVDKKAANVEVKNTKRSLNKQYKQLKLDKRADAGKNLYKQGHTIDEITQRSYVRSVLIMLGSAATSRLIANTTGSYVAANTVVLGTNTVNFLLAIRDQDRVNKLRAYYAH